MKLFFTLLFTFVSFMGYAQLQFPQGRSIRGFIYDDRGAPLTGASVTLFQQDEPEGAKTVRSDEKGYFSLEPGAFKSPYLVVSFTGYRKLLISWDQIRAAKQGNLGGLELRADANALEQVTITTKRPMIKQLTDRTVVVVNEQAKKLAENALELIRLAPGLTVSDQEDALQLAGKEGVEVMINDKKVRMNSRDLVKFLKSLPIAAIKELEVIPNASSKYELTGNTGLLNIKTQRSEIKGLNGNLDLSHSQAAHSLGDLSANLSYAREKLALSTYLAYHYGNYPTLTQTTRLLGEGLLQQNALRAEHWKDPAMRLNAEYFLSPKHTLGAIMSYERSRNKSNYPTSSVLSDGSATDANFRSEGNGTNTSRWDSYNLNYRFSGSAGSELSVDLDRSVYHKDELMSIINLGSAGLSSSQHLYHTLTFTSINSLKGDYSHLWKDKTRLEAGFKYSGVKTENSLEVSGNAATSPIDQNLFSYRENVAAGYLNLSKNFGKWGIQLGLRAERSKIAGFAKSNKDAPLLKPDSVYLNLLPAVYLSYLPSANHAFRLSYNERIKRPNYSDLQPFSYQLDLFSYQMGNPGLRLQRSSNTELAYTYAKGLTVSAGYTRTSDVINAVVYTLANLTYETPLNSGRLANYNLSLSYPLSVNKVWTMVNKINGFYNHFSGQLYQGILNDGGFGFSFSSSQRFTLAGNYSLILSGRYSSAVQNLIFYQRQNGNVSASVSRRLFHDQGSLRIGMSDIFYTNRKNTWVNFGNLNYTRRESWESRRVLLSFTYRFGDRKAKQTQERTTGNSEEKSRGGS